MGEHAVHVARGARDTRAFTQAVLRDVTALERLIARGTIETGIRRLGVEQEMYLVDRDGRPLACAPQLLAQLRDPRFTTEITRFNLEANLPPRRLEGGVLHALEEAILEAVGTASTAATRFGGRVLLPGILPTLRPEDLGRDCLTPEPRYAQLNEAIFRAHGPITVVIDGVDQFEGTYDSVALERGSTRACSSICRSHPARAGPSATWRSSSPAPYWPRAPTRPCCSAAASGRRRAWRCSSAPSTPGVARSGGVAACRG